MVPRDTCNTITTKVKRWATKIFILYIECKVLKNKTKTYTKPTVLHNKPRYTEQEVN